MEFDFKLLVDRHPFLSIGKYANNEYVGIIQNVSKAIVSMYNYSSIEDKKLKEQFLELGGEYWWSSNRMIPIDIFLHGEFDIFRPYLLSFNAKEFELMYGPSVSLGSIGKKRIKRKMIQLVRYDSVK